MDCAKSQSPSSQTKARIQAYEALVEKQTANEAEHIIIPAGPRLGSVVIEEKIAKGFGEKTMIEDLSFHLRPGYRWYYWPEWCW